MHRFYCPNLPSVPPNSIPEAEIELDADQAHHARRTLRLTPGSEVEVFDGRGRRGGGVVARCDKQAVTVKLHSLEQVDPPRPSLTLAVASPKGPRYDDMVNQLSQLGVDQLIPLRTAHSGAEPGDGRRERFERIAIESAKQCGRSHLLRIEPAADFAAVLKMPADLRWIAAPPAPGSAGTAGNTETAGNPALGNASPLTPYTLPLLSGARTVLVLIGPEGGWSEAEQNAALIEGFTPLLLGPHVLRIETAAVAAAALVRSLAALAQHAG